MVETLALQGTGGNKKIMEKLESSHVYSQNFLHGSFCGTADVLHIFLTVLK